MTNVEIVESIIVVISMLSIRCRNGIVKMKKLRLILNCGFFILNGVWLCYSRKICYCLDVAVLVIRFIVIGRMMFVVCCSGSICLW